MEILLDRRAFLQAAALPALAPARSRASRWPDRPVKIVVPFPPGSAGDAIPRAIAARLQAQWGEACVIDNRPGAAGAIGAGLVARAEPDGHTLLSHSSAIAIRPHVAATPYDVLADFVPVTQTVAGSYVLLVHPDFPAASLQQWLQVVRRRPGRFSYGSYGSGSGPHLAMELLKERARLYILHVPYRGAAPALQDLLAGRIDMAFDTTFAGVPQVRAGRLRALAVGGLQPVDALPGVPTIASLFGGFDTDGWQGIFAPAGTPPGRVRQLQGDVAAALRDPALARQVADLGFRLAAAHPEAFRPLLERDFRRWGDVVRRRGIRADG